MWKQIFSVILNHVLKFLWPHHTSSDKKVLLSSFLITSATVTGKKRKCALKYTYCSYKKVQHLETPRKCIKLEDMRVGKEIPYIIIFILSKPSPSKNFLKIFKLLNKFLVFQFLADRIHISLQRTANTTPMRLNFHLVATLAAYGTYTSCLFALLSLQSGTQHFFAFILSSIFIFSLYFAIHQLVAPQIN